MKREADISCGPVRRNANGERFARPGFVRAHSLLAGALFALIAHLGHANRFDDKDDILVQQTPRHLSGIGRVELTIGQVARQSGTGFLVSPCHIVTNHHALVLKSESERLKTWQVGNVHHLDERVLDTLKQKLRDAYRDFLEEQTFGPGGSAREISFLVYRDSNNRLDRTKKLRIQKFLLVDIYDDFALARLAPCVEEHGPAPFDIPDKEELSSIARGLKESGAIRVFTAGYPGDKDPSFLSVSSCIPPFYQDFPASRMFQHRCNSVPGTSGSPMFVLVEQGGQGQSLAHAFTRFLSEPGDYQRVNGRAQKPTRLIPFALITSGLRNPNDPNVAYFFFDPTEIYKRIREDLDKYPARMNSAK